MEGTPRGQVRRVGHVALEDDPVAAERGIGKGHGREQGPGVGVQRSRVQLVPRGRFDDLSEVHDGHPVADVAHHAEVVGDEQVAETEPFLQHLEQVDDLRLDRNVECRDRFVGDDQFGPDGQGPGDADALPLAAAELVGIPAGVRGVKAHRFEQVGHAVARIRLACSIRARSGVP